jgi:hypothetical protein
LVGITYDVSALDAEALLQLGDEVVGDFVQQVRWHGEELFETLDLRLKIWIRA